MVWVYMAWAAMVWIDLRLVSLHFLRVEVGIELLSLANNVLNSPVVLNVVSSNVALENHVTNGVSSSLEFSTSTKLNTVGKTEASDH